MRLGLDQADLLTAEVKTRTSVYNYESGNRSPDAEFLSSLAVKGFDLLYVLTGSRSFAPPDPLTPREAVLLENYRRAGVTGQRTIESTAAAFAAGGGGESTSHVQHFHGPMLGVAGRDIKGTVHTVYKGVKPKPPPKG